MNKEYSLLYIILEYVKKNWLTQWNMRFFSVYEKITFIKNDFLRHNNEINLQRF
jgi:hypothetical protein